MDALESLVGTELFLRSTPMLTLTDSGRVLFSRAQQILEDLADAHEEISSMRGEVQGTLRVACGPTFGRRYVLPVIAILSIAIRI
jgi:DNA-binding transcriptional LysR family regulator